MATKRMPDTRVKCNDCFALGVLEKRDEEDMYYCRVGEMLVRTPYHPHMCNEYRFYD